MAEPNDLDFDFDREPVDPMTWAPPRFLRRHATRSARRRRLRRLAIAAGVGVLGFGFLFADGGLASILWRRFRIHRLEQQVVSLEARREWLQAEAQRRKKDRATIERLAREEYGMIYPGEKLLRIVPVSEKEARRVEKQRERLENDLAHTAALEAERQRDASRKADRQVARRGSNR